MWTDLIEWFAKVVGILGFGYMVGREVSKIKQEKINDRLRRAKIKSDLEASRARARFDLSSLSDEELVDRVARTGAAKAEEEPYKK